MNYYRDQVTQKSWQMLQDLTKKYQFILIGGWAVWLYTQQLKSKDIDIIVEFEQLAKLKDQYPLIKNDRLFKYEINQGEVQIDIYVPHYSQLGSPVEIIFAQSQIVDGFRVPRPEQLLALKLTAYRGRIGTSKGRKDLIDIVSLLQLPQLDWLLIPPEIITMVNTQTEIPELGLNRHQFTRLKKQWASKLC